MKKVVILSAFLHPFRSGAEACAEEVAKALAGRYDVHLVTARLRRNLPRQDMLDARVRVTRLGFGLSADKWLFPFIAPLAVLKIKPDITHVILESFAGLAMVICSFFIRSKYILTCQSTNTSFLVGLMHRRARQVTVISWVLQERAKRLGRPDAILIPNGMPADAIAAALAGENRVPGRILFAGRLEDMKGVDTLLEAFRLLLNSGVSENINLRIAGDGSLRDNLMIQSEDLGLSESVTFAGYIPFPDVYKEFAQAEIFCGLSRQEAFGNVFIEAQAAGCAVVATAVQGIPDIVKDEETGLLVPADDPERAASALKKLIEDEALRKKISAAGSKHAAAFDWRIIAEKYAEVYEE